MNPGKELATDLLVMMLGQSLRKQTPEQTRTHPAAESFPGPVPQTAPRLGAVAVAVDTKVSDWTFDGTGEVTCNLFSLYVMDKLCGFFAVFGGVEW